MLGRYHWHADSWLFLQGQAITSMQWGAWGGTGMAVTHNLLPRIIQSGLGVLAPAAGLAALASALQLSRHITSSMSPSQLVVSPLDWPKLMAGASTIFPLFSEFAHHATAAAARKNADQLAAQPAEDLQQLVMQSREAHVSSILAKIQTVVHNMLGALPEAEQPLMEAGLDSLGSVELRSQLEKLLDMQLPATLMFDYPSMSAMAAFIASLQAPMSQQVDPQPCPIMHPAGQVP